MEQMARYRKISTWLTTEKEMEVLKAVKDGCSYAEMNRELKVTDHVITFIKRKYGLLGPVIPQRPVAS